MTAEDPRIALLKAAGYADAADFLSAADAALGPARAPQPEQREQPQAPAGAVPAGTAAYEQARQAEAATLLDALHAGTGGRFRS
jgi:hypothetical protein